MVLQARSDWPKNRKWSSQELQRLWEDLSADTHSQIRRGLLIDWGFAALERSTNGEEAVELTAEDVTVFEPVEYRPPTYRNVVKEEDAKRHCETGIPVVDDEAIYPIVPLWNLQDDSHKVIMNTQEFVRAAMYGQINLEWTNAALCKAGGQPSNATVRVTVRSLKVSC